MNRRTPLKPPAGQHRRWDAACDFQDGVDSLRIASRYDHIQRENARQL